ncbi:hypothetical protein MBLNU457_7235t1 [Dothideomycetes sp. NU457]
MSTTTPGFSLQITVHIKPENVERFLQEFNPIFELVIREPECVLFEVFQSPEDPGTLSWVENWSESPEWFFEHQLPKAYYKPYLEATEPMFIAPREIKVLNRLPLQYYSQTAA